MFTQKVSEAFSDILESYLLEIISINEHTAALVNDSYILEIMYDNDGVKCVYYDLSNPKRRGYNLDMFLLHKRADKLVFTEYDKNQIGGYLSHSLNLLSSNLKLAGSDILSGDKAWVKKYHWPPFFIESDLLDKVVQ
jgi:hypothetical protein